MGIQGLIPLLEKSSTPVNVSQFSGCTVAVDAYCWLHKGVYTCAEKLARGEDCQAYVYYCMRFVSMLLAKNIKPILVFDGQHLPAKADTELKRRKIREENRKKAAELMRLDKGKEASSLLRRSIDVTHKMALNLIKQCRAINVDCIVAPYEADSQLAYLNLSGIADLVITEDSDLLLFGCKRVLFKLDQLGGGLLIDQDKLYLSMNMRPEQFDFNKFRYMCILSGCDYLPSIPGVGLIKARQFITRTIESDIYKSLLRLGSFMNVKVPSEYRNQFLDADRMFQYQPVYDPLSRQVVPLNKVSDPNVFLLDSKLTPDQTYQLALGNIDPISLKVMDNWDPDIQITPKSKIVQACHKSIWSKDYQAFRQEPNICVFSQATVKTPTKRAKVINTLSQTSPKEKSPKIKPSYPVTEEDILNTLEEIYVNEKISEINDFDTKKKTQSTYHKDHTIIENYILTPEIDNIIVENETPNIFKQSTKRKYTVINPEKQIISGYFTSKTSKTDEIVKDDKEEWINPFKCRKVITPKKKEENTNDLNVSLSPIHSIEENKSQDEKIVEEINSNTFHKNTGVPNSIQKAFSWKNYSSSLTVIKSEGCNKNKTDCILPDIQNDNILLNDSEKIDNDNDIDEGFCSQNIKELSITPQKSKRSYPKTGLSKNVTKKGQTLLSKFGFKMTEQLKR